MKGYMISNEDKHKYSVGVGYYSPNYKKYPFYLSLDDCPQRTMGSYIYEIDALGKIISDKDNDKVYYTDMIKIVRALPAATREKNGEALR